MMLKKFYSWLFYGSNIGKRRAYSKFLLCVENQLNVIAYWIPGHNTDNKITDLMSL